MKPSLPLRDHFRISNKEGKLKWARSWASAPSVEARLHEVQAAQNPSGPDSFLYALYSWFSSAVHGGPNSLSDMLKKANDPTDHFAAAAAVLAFTLGAAVEDLELSQNLGAQIERYSEAVMMLKKPKQRPKDK